MFCRSNNQMPMHTDFHTLESFFKACEYASRRKTSSESMKEFDLDKIADLFITHQGSFRSVMQTCCQRLGHGGQKELSESLDVPPQTISNWFKKWGIPKSITLR